MPYHVWISAEGSYFGIHAWNLEEERLLHQFLEPYRRGRPITTGGEVVEVKDLRKIRIASSEALLRPDDYADKLELFKALEDVTDVYILGPPGYEASQSTSVVQDGVDRALELIARFPRVANALRARPQNRDPLTMDDEYDVQYLLRALLESEFEDVRLEEWTPSYAWKSSRMDFLLHQEQVVIETKRSRASMTSASVGSELIVDTARYAEHPRCKTLICFVYDPEHHLANPRGLENDLSGIKEGGLDVRVAVTPRL